MGAPQREAFARQFQLFEDTFMQLYPTVMPLDWKAGHWVETPAEIQ